MKSRRCCDGSDKVTGTLDLLDAFFLDVFDPERIRLFPKLFFNVFQREIHHTNCHSKIVFTFCQKGTLSSINKKKEPFFVKKLIHFNRTAF